MSDDPYACPYLRGQGDGCLARIEAAAVARWGGLACSAPKDLCKGDAEVLFFMLAPSSLPNISSTIATSPRLPARQNPKRFARHQTIVRTRSLVYSLVLYSRLYPAEQGCVWMAQRQGGDGGNVFSANDERGLFWRRKPWLAGRVL